MSGFYSPQSIIEDLSPHGIKQLGLIHSSTIYNGMSGQSDELQHVQAYLAYSSPTWNETYYNNVRKKLEARGTNNGGEGCFKPFKVTSQVDIGEGYLVSMDRRTTCRTFTSGFVQDFNNLPTTLEGNEQAYVNFCLTYGFHFPSKFIRLKE